MDLSRKTAYEIIYDILESNAYTNIALNKKFQAGEFTGRERKFISMLVYGTISYKLTLDYIIEKFTNRSLNQINKRIRNILRMGIYQLIFCDSIPDYSACNESVDLAKKLTNRKAAGFVNAVLRNVSRKDTGIKLPSKTNFVKYLSVKYSMPANIIKKLAKVFNAEQMEKFCKASLKKADVCIRVNTVKTDIDSIYESLSEKGFNVSRSGNDSSIIKIDGASGLFDTDEFKKGMFIVMDESAMLPVKALDLKPDQTVIDCCAAPGGKTAAISQMMNNKGKVYAWDIYEHKLKLMEKTFRRLGLLNIECQVNDSRVLNPAFNKKADRVLIDAPCSGLGIIRRKPDIKWKYKEDYKLYELQQSILETCSKYVKEGGVLVYSTCTVIPEENELRIKKFLDDNNDFSLADISFKNTLVTKYKDGTFINTYPHVNKTDGFFTAKMVRK